MSKSTTLPKEISEYFAALGPKGAASIKGTEARQRSDPRRWQPQKRRTVTSASKKLEGERQIAI